MDVRRLRDPSEAPALAAVLARAMQEDPFVRWVSGADVTRAQHFLLAGLTRIGIPHGVVFATADLSGGAILLPPGAAPTPLDQLRMLPKLARAAGTRRVPAVLRALTRLERAHPPEPHWSGIVLAVDPRRQRGGVGSALIEAALARVDADGKAAYLETCGERLIGLYRRCGFEPVTSIDLPAGGPTLVGMWRSAR